MHLKSLANSSVDTGSESKVRLATNGDPKLRFYWLPSFLLVHREDLAEANDLFKQVNEIGII